jgi:hypothetical protein
MVIRVNDAGYVYSQGIWLPPINAKQFEIFVDSHRYLLVHGPRKSGKTFGIIHKVLKHAFDVNGAMVAIVCKTIKNAKSAGVWALLERMLPIWTSKCPGFEIVEGPKVTGDTKMSYVRIRNRHGTISEIQCHSLQNAGDVEEKFKGPAYSMFWLSEFDQYCTLHAFNILCDALRMTPMVPYEQHQIICDCNPPETGEDNWIHDQWFKDKDKGIPEGDDRIFWEGLHRILVAIDDNPQLDEREKRELMARYKKRQGLYDRFIKGLWTQDITDGHFSEIWDETVHVVGSAEGTVKENWDIIVPTEACHTLLTGWDLGDSINHSFHILEKLQMDVIIEDPKTRAPKEVVLVGFSIIDELFVLGERVSTRDFTEEAMEKIGKWEKFIKARNPAVRLNWRHWSDTHAFNYNAQADSSGAAIVYETSGQKIILEGAPKHRGSKRDRVNIVGEFLSQERLFTSAQLFYTRGVMVNLRKGTTAAEFIKDDKWRHGFDSLSYPIIAEAPEDMMRGSDVRSRRQSEVSSVVAA